MGEVRAQHPDQEGDRERDEHGMDRVPEDGRVAARRVGKRPHGLRAGQFAILLGHVRAFLRGSGQASSAEPSGQRSGSTGLSRRAAPDPG
ncbi:MAG: hypothetical protein GEU78_18355 [Actinobacteria bacterium]|nr:hypothetical protein [Actinomycetota bacterium]